MKVQAISNTKWGNVFHKRVEKLLRDIDLGIRLSSFTAEGPDIIAFDTETKTKIIVQCRASRTTKVYKSINALVNEYAERKRDAHADLAIIALFNYKLRKGIDLEDIFRRKHVRFMTLETIKEYESLVAKIGAFAKYQILSDLGISRKFQDEIALPSLRIDQPGASFYVCSAPAQWLLKSASVFRRTGPELHISGYQRVLTKNRVKKEIPSYLNQDRWILPNAIICATQPALSTLKYKHGILRLPSQIGLLWVIDGQHRLYSFPNSEPRQIQYSLLLVILDSSRMKDAETEQADIFLKLNAHAKRVQPALSLELMKDLIGTSDMHLKVAFELCEAKVLKNLVRTYSKKVGMIDLVTLATTPPMKQLTGDRSPILKSTKLTDEIKVKRISRFIEKYFKEVKAVFKKEWGDPNYIISDNRGVRALLRILIYFFEHNRTSSQTRILLKCRAAFKLLKNREKFDAPAFQNQFLGEGGADKLATQWIMSFSGVPAQVIPRFENERVEFKSTLKWDIEKNQVNRDLPQEVTRAVCALQNSSGGSVFIGIDDNGKVLGLDNDMQLHTKRGNAEDAIWRAVNDYLREDLKASDAARVRYELLRDSSKRPYIKLSVDPSDHPVYFKRKKLYVRHGAASVLLEGEEMEKYLASHFNFGR